MAAKYLVRDDQVTEYLRARTLRGAVRDAERWLRSGSWDSSATRVLRATVERREGAECEDVCVILPAIAPPCTARHHRWDRPFAKVGGLRENPGVHGGPGGGITILEVCRHCGVRRVTQTAGDDGAGGTCRRVEYVEAAAE